MSSLDQFDLRDKVVDCVKRNGVVYKEVWVYPYRRGLRVEILPCPSIDDLNKVAECIRREIGLEARVESRPYGLVVIIS